jgi:hypothetical protein
MNDVADPDPETPADGLRRPPLDDDEDHHAIPERYPLHPLHHTPGTLPDNAFDYFQSDPPLETAAQPLPRRSSSTQMTGFGQAAETIALGMYMGSHDGKVSPQSRRTPSTSSTLAMREASRLSATPEHLFSTARSPYLSSHTTTPEPPSPIQHTPSYAYQPRDSRRYSSRSAVSLSAYPYDSHPHGRDLNPTKRSNSAQFQPPPSSYLLTAGGGGGGGTSAPSSPTHRSITPTNLKDFMGLLKRNRNSAPAIVDHYDDDDRPESSLEGRRQPSPASANGTLTARESVLFSPSPSILRVPSIPIWSANGASSSFGNDQVPTPPPEPADDLPIMEGLLDPRLSLLNQDSTASLGDDRDYSRPIGGILVHHLHSSTASQDSSPNNTNEGE